MLYEKGLGIFYVIIIYDDNDDAKKMPKISYVKSVTLYVARKVIMKNTY